MVNRAIAGGEVLGSALWTGSSEVSVILLRKMTGVSKLLAQCQAFDIRSFPCLAKNVADCTAICIIILLYMQDAEKL